MTEDSTKVHSWGFPSNWQAAPPKSLLSLAGVCCLYDSGWGPVNLVSVQELPKPCKSLGPPCLLEMMVQFAGNSRKAEQGLQPSLCGCIGP